MALTILQEPPALCLAGNLPDIIASSTDTLAENFSISVDGTLILEETYVPDSQGRINIRIREILEDQLAVQIPVGNLFIQDEAVKDIECLLGSEAIDFRIVKGGVDRTAFNSLDFLEQNWLTWQPQSKVVKYGDPEFLSYYALANVDVRVKAYFQGGTDETITIANLLSDNLYTINVNFQYIRSLFATQPIYLDIWVEDSGSEPLTYVQRYVLTDEIFDYDDLFVFENSLGGIDTVRFTGQKELLNKSQFDAAIFFDEIELDYGINPDRAFEKNTGYFQSKRALAWSQDFFSSLQKYIFEKGNLVRILVKEPEVTDIKYELIDFDFKFIYTRQTQYLDLVESDEYMGLLVIIGPDDEEYYLVPRLWEFPILTDPTDALFPVQTTGNAQWQTLSFQTILSYILANINIDIPDAADGIIEPGTLVINSPTSATLTGASWRKSGTLYSYTGPVSITGTPSDPDSRVDIIYTLTSNAVGYQAGVPDEDPIVPNAPSGSMVLHQILRLNTGENIITPANPTDPTTEAVLGHHLEYAPIWRQTLLVNTYYDFKIGYVGWASDYTTYGQRPLNGILMVDFVSKPSLAEIDPARPPVLMTVDTSPEGGDFVLMMTSSTQATVFVKKTAYLQNLTFQYLGPRTFTVNKNSVLNGGAYAALPSGDKYTSRNQLDYVPSTGNVRFDAPRSYGYNGTPVTGNITVATAYANGGYMAKVLHNGSVEPTVSVPGGVTKRKLSGEYEAGADNIFFFIVNKNIAGEVTSVDYRIEQNQL